MAIKTKSNPMVLFCNLSYLLLWMKGWNDWTKNSLTTTHEGMLILFRNPMDPVLLIQDEDNKKEIKTDFLLLPFITSALLRFKKSWKYKGKRGERERKNKFQPIKVLRHPSPILLPFYTDNQMHKFSNKLHYSSIFLVFSITNQTR